MKKIIVITAILLTGTVMANAEMDTGAQVRANIKAKAVQMMGTTTRPTMGTSTKGTSTKDVLGLQIKALNMEMEAKIKLIRDEYQAKIKALIATNAGNASTTRGTSIKGERKIEVEGGEQNDDTKRVVVGSSTEDRVVPPMPRLRINGQVKGAVAENDEQGGGFGKFIRGLFGGR